MQRQFSLQEHIQIAETSGLSLCVLDSGLKCVFSNGTINTGDRLSDMLHKRAELPVRGCFVSCITVGDCFYCVRIFSVSCECEPEYYMCEVLDSAAAQKICENTELVNGNIYALEAVRYRLDKVEKLADALCTNVVATHVGAVAELRSRMNKLRAVLDTIAAYHDMSCLPHEKVLFDAGKLCERLCVRCNAALSSSGRCMRLPLCDEGLYVCADGRNTVVSFMSIVANALACASEDSVPQIVVYRDGVSEQVVIKMLNTPTALCGTNVGESAWLMLVRCYAERIGGSVELLCGEQSTLLLSLPAASPAEIAVYKLESELDSIYDEELSRMLELMLSHHEMTANVQ